MTEEEFSEALLSYRMSHPEASQIDQTNRFEIEDQMFDCQDFSNYTLFDIGFKHCEFHGCNFYDADAFGSDFVDCKFSMCGFKDGHFRKCSFDDSTFRLTSFKDASISKCSFRGADLRGADLRGAYILYCDFSNANLHPSSADEGLIEIFKASFALDMANLLNRQDLDDRYISKYYSTENKGEAK